MSASATQGGHKNKMLRRNGPVIKSVESVLRPEESLWWERFVEDVGLVMDKENFWHFKS